MKYHEICLIEYKGKLESVALTSTNYLSEDQKIVLLRGGQPLIPISEIKDYVKEVETCGKIVTELHKAYLNKNIAQARAFCESQGTKYSVVTD